MPFIISEFVEGVMLADLLPASPSQSPTFWEAAHLIAQVAEACNMPTARRGSVLPRPECCLLLLVPLVISCWSHKFTRQTPC